MKVGSLLRNKSFPKSMGIVLHVWRDDVRIHWIKSSEFTIWSEEYDIDPTPYFIPTYETVEIPVPNEEIIETNKNIRIKHFPC